MAPPATRRRTRFLHLLPGLVLAAASAAADAARPEDDSFSGPTLDTCRWFDWSRQAGISHGGALRLQTDGRQTFGNAFVTSQYTVGDVVAEVDVALGQGFEQPLSDPTVQLYAGLGLYVDGGNQLFVALARTPQGLVVRTLRVAQDEGERRYDNPPTVPLAVSSTRLRVERQGGRVTLSFRDGSRWVVAARFDGFAAPALVTLQTTHIGLARTLSAAFSGFTLGPATASSHRPYVPGERIARTGVLNGGVVTDYLYQREWTDLWKGADPLRSMAAQGLAAVRTGVTTLSAAALRDTPRERWGSLPFEGAFWSSLEATTQVLQEAQDLGLRKVLFFYLSDGAAHAGRQGGPAAWRALSLPELEAALRAHTAGVAAHLRQRGIGIDLYEVGNETLVGMLGVAFGDRVAEPAGGVDVFTDVPLLRRLLWRDHARLYKAAIDGIRSVDPLARIGLHPEGVGQSPADLVVKAFFRTMVDEGVPFDVAGLSLPYSTYPWTLDRYQGHCWFQRLQETVDTIGALGKQVIVSEASYPADAAAAVAAPMPGFAYSPAGQAAWLREHLRFSNDHPFMGGFFYFYPEWRPGAGNGDPAAQPIEAAGLFAADGSARPALLEFGLPGGESRTDCLFRWGERQFPQLLQPPGVQTAVHPPYVYRHYHGSGAYVGLAGAEPRLYYLDPASKGTPSDLGPAADWWATAGCLRPAAGDAKGAAFRAGSADGRASSNAGLSSHPRAAGR